MTRIDDVLKENEKIDYRTGTHWVILGGPAMLLFLAGISISSQGMSAIVLFIIAIIWIILSYIILQNTEYAITNNRLLVRTVFPWKKLREIELTEVVHTTLYQPTLGKLLNFGKITVIFTNGGRLNHRMVKGRDNRTCFYGYISQHQPVFCAFYLKAL